MSQQVLKVRPTKIELIRLKRRIKVARRLHKVLKDRLIILSQELIALVREGLTLRTQTYDQLEECFKTLHRSSFLTTPITMDAFASSRIRKSEVVIGTRVVAGVKVPVIEIERVRGKYDPGTYPLTLIDAGECFDKAVDEALKLAEVETSILLIGREVSRVRRRVNALENLLIPRIEATIKYLSMKFEEREREDKARMKKVKQMLERRS